MKILQRQEIRVRAYQEEKKIPHKMQRAVKEGRWDKRATVCAAGLGGVCQDMNGKGESIRLEGSGTHLQQGLDMLASLHLILTSALTGRYLLPHIINENHSNLKVQ